MKKIPSITIFVKLLLLCVCGNAQNRNANVYLNNFYLGINTKDRVLLPQQPKPDPVTDFTLNFSSISDEKTGQLLFYTDGKKVYRPDHTVMQNGMLFDRLGETKPIIIPDPAETSKYYLFYIKSDSLCYAKVSLNNGGVVLYKDSLIATGIAGECLAAFSYIHKEGWWILTHAANGNEFYSFLLLRSGINKNPVKSSTSFSITSANQNIKFSYSSFNGEKILVQFRDRYIVQSAVLTIDKKCGKLVIQKSFLTDSIGVFTASPVFSPDDSKIYIVMRSNHVIQYSGSDYQDSVSCFDLLYRNGNGWTVLYPGIDGAVYIAQWSHWEGRYQIDIIENPNAKYPACNIQTWKTVPADVNYTHLNVPAQITDQSLSTGNLQDGINFTYDNACKQFTVNFTANHDALYDSVMWQFGDGSGVSDTSRNPSHTFTQNGDYVVKLMGFICGQADTVSKVLRVREQPTPDLGSDTSICFGSFVTLTSNIKADAYLWSDSSRLEQLTVSRGGKYWLQLSFGDCKRADTIEVDQNPQIWTALGDEYLICEDDKEVVKLDAGEQFKQYKWTPTGDTTQWIIVGDVGEYFVVVQDYRRCKGEDGTRVQRRCGVKLYFPNVFTPNGDGLNDVFKPNGKDVVDFNMKIFNRWGQQVFESTNMEQGWDGTLRGEKASSDVYTYTVEYTGYINKKLKEFATKGTFTLMR